MQGTWLFLSSLSAETDTRPLRVGEGVEEGGKEGDGVRSRLRVAGEGERVKRSGVGGQESGLGGRRQGVGVRRRNESGGILGSGDSL